MIWDVPDDTPTERMLPGVSDLLCDRIREDDDTPTLTPCPACKGNGKIERREESSTQYLIFREICHLCEGLRSVPGDVARRWRSDDLRSAVDEAFRRLEG